MRGLNISENIKKVMIALIEKNKPNITNYCKKGYIQLEYLFQEIAEYPGKIVFPPEKAFLDYESLAIDANSTVVWFNLWFDDKKSDLILELLLTRDETKKVKITIQGLRVM